MDPLNTDGLQRLRDEIQASDAFDDVDLEQVVTYIDFVTEQQQKYQERMSALANMRRKIRERMQLLQRAERFVDFPRHPKLVSFFAKRQKRLLRIMDQVRSS